MFTGLDDSVTLSPSRVKPFAAYNNEVRAHSLDIKGTEQRDIRTENETVWEVYGEYTADDPGYRHAKNVYKAFSVNRGANSRSNG